MIYKVQSELISALNKQREVSNTRSTPHENNINFGAY
jgi:hypothetical protein